MSWRMGLRGYLDGLYRASGVLGALFLVAIFAIVLLQVAANAVNALAVLIIDRPLGLSVPSHAEFAGFFLAASSFLALAHSLHAGAHIRVSLVLDRLGPGKRRLIEVWCAGSGTLIAGYFSFFAARMTFESAVYGDLSPGVVAVPLWLPQSAMTLGLGLLTLALADRLWQSLTGGEGTLA